MAEDEQSIDHEEQVRVRLAALHQAALRIAVALERIADNTEPSSYTRPAR